MIIFKNHHYQNEQHMPVRIVEEKIALSIIDENLKQL